MKDGLVPGLTLEQTYDSTLEMRAKQLRSDVFSTPALIGLMELTCVRLVEPYLEKDEQTVGIHVDVRHMAATRIGPRVTVTVALLEMKDKKLRFSVSASNDQGVKIGEGTHRRAVIDMKRFAGS